MLTKNPAKAAILLKTFISTTLARATILLKTFTSAIPARATIFEFSTKKICSEQTMNTLKQP